MKILKKNSLLEDIKDIDKKRDIDNLFIILHYQNRILLIIEKKSNTLIKGNFIYIR
jgi:hypothetical protein